jgi:hypothetical protein
MGFFKRKERFFSIENIDAARDFITGLGLICKEGIAKDTLFGFMENPYLGTRDMFVDLNGLVLIWEGNMDGTFRMSTTLSKYKTYNPNEKQERYTLDFSKGFSPMSEDEIVDSLAAIQDNIKFRLNQEYAKELDKILDVL